MSEPESIRLPAPGAEPASEADAGRMLQILWRGKWILLLVPVLAYLGARFWLQSRTVLYMATAQVQVDSREPNLLRDGGGTAINKPRTVLKQQQSLLRSSTLLMEAARSPTVTGLKHFAPERLNGNTVFSELYNNLSTSIDVESDRVLISFISPYREEAETVVDEVLRIYLEYQKTRKKQQVETVAEIIRSEWESYKRDLEATTTAISDLRAQHLLPAGTDRTPLQVELDETNRALNGAHQETLRLAGTHARLLEASQDAQAYAELGLYWRASRPINALEEKFDELRRRRDDLEQRRQRLLLDYGGDLPELVRLRDQIEDLQRQEGEIALRYAAEYLRSTEVDLAKARSYEAALNADLDELNGRLVEENRLRERLADLERERDSLRETVGRFGERITQLEVETQTGGLNLDVIEHARAPSRPTYPETEKTYVYALGGGMIFAFGVVLLLGLADRRIRDIEEVPRLLGASVLGVLPEAGGGKRSRVARLLEEQPDSLVAEAIRNVRAAALFALKGGRGIVVVTSANASEGKSVCASNLACALARGGRRTLLLDADLRNPTQHEIYGVEPGEGLAGLLCSSLPVRRAIVPEAAAGLDLLPAGAANGRAAELCDGRVLSELLRSLRESYDCIVIDSPSVLESAEARVLASLADAVVFVLRLDFSLAPSVKRAAGILRSVGARILGALPNRASSRRGARDFAGGISYGTASVEGAPSSEPRPLERRGAADRRAQGTSSAFLGVEEESA